jgi:hypothetical protein
LKAVNPTSAPVTVSLPPTPGQASNRIWVERAGLAERLRHEGAFLLLALGVITVAFILPTLKAHNAWVDIPCVFHKVTHVPCLACGLTRSCVLTARGDFIAAFSMHLLGPMIFIGICLDASYLAFSVISGHRVRYTLSGRARRIAFWSVLGIFFVSWGIKLAFMRSSW